MASRSSSLKNRSIRRRSGPRKRIPPDSKVPLAEQVKRFESLFDATPVGVALLDRNLRYVYINECLAAINGRPAHEHAGLTPREVVPEISEGIIDDFRKVIQTGESCTNIEIYGETPALPGTPKHWLCTYTPITSDKGVVEYLAVLVQDITDRRVAEEQREKAYEDLKMTQSQLIRSEKLASIGMLVSGVAHELNNPLSVIYGNLRLLAEAYEAATKPGGNGRLLPPKARRMVKDSINAANHARNILQEFRQFARDTRSADVVDLNQCLEDAWSLLTHHTKLNLKLVRRLRKLPPISCVRGQLTQVFLNLLNNAAEATDGKGTITVTSGWKDDLVLVEIADDGRGVPQDVKAKLFEPFFTTKSDGEGLGLGLSISALIAHNHGGEITLLSRAGQGARFRLTLPVTPPKQGPAPLDPGPRVK